MYLCLTHYKLKHEVSMSVLFESIKIGSLELKNRIVLAPLTRARASEGRIPNDLMATYYEQRSTAGLIISEATAITESAVGYANTPGIWSDHQIEGWKKITKVVHASGSKIVLQLWHVGRISDPMFLDGNLPVAPSAIAAKGHVSLVRPQKEYVTPRALETYEVKQIVQDYKKAAQNAKLAGFDGVEIHGANGYLIDQFLHSSTNHRTDEYGGNLENRARFALEVTDAILEVWDASRVGYHISPRGDSHDIFDENPLRTFTYLMEQLSKRKLAFVFAREHQGEGKIGDKLRKAFSGAYIVNEKLTKESAEELIRSDRADAAAFGLAYISNPDLPTKFLESKPLREVDFQTIYAEGELGYTDY